MKQEMPPKILVVDDEPSVIDWVSQILREKGYMVSIARNGREGLKQCELVKPDLVITDIIMPDMEGIEFIRALGKRNQDTPIVVMSGNIVGTKFLKTARLFGAKATLRKPFSSQELIDTVRELLSGE